MSNHTSHIWKAWMHVESSFNSCWMLVGCRLPGHYYIMIIFAVYICIKYQNYELYVCQWILRNLDKELKTRVGGYYWGQMVRCCYCILSGIWITILPVWPLSPASSSQPQTLSAKYRKEKLCFQIFFTFSDSSLAFSASWHLLVTELCQSSKLCFGW